MPLTPVDYSKTIIYKIQHIEDDSLLYVGSTTDFTRRKSQHKHHCNNNNSKNYNQKKYQMIRDNGGWDAFIMIEIEKFPCRDSREARRREDAVMREMKCTMNMRKSHCGFDTRQEYSKQHYKDNKETINEKFHCECGGKFTRAHMAKHKKTKKHINFMNNQQ
jgi:hypothetical protein